MFRKCYLLIIIFTGFCVGCENFSNIEKEKETHALAEIKIKTDSKVNILQLKANTPRMHGKTKGRISVVGAELAGAQFTQVGWQSTISFEVTVTESGYLYTLKGSKEEREKSELNWEHRPEAITGPYLPGAHRIKLQKGYVFKTAGYELALVAGKIGLSTNE